MFSSCEYGIWEGFYRPNPVDERAASLLELEDGPTADLVSEVRGGKYKILVLSDMRYGKNGDTDLNVSKLFDWLSYHGNEPDFCINLGDCTEHGKPEEFDSYLDFENALKASGVRNVYSVVGNQDLYNSGWNQWKEKIYPGTSFYRFSTDGISFYFIDSASGSLGKRQMEILKSEMEADQKSKIVVSHYPIYSNSSLSIHSLQESTEVDFLIDLFNNNKVIQVIDGHAENYAATEYPNYTEINVPGLNKNGRWVLITVDESKMSVKHRNITW